jgi:hypothetical protein
MTENENQLKEKLLKSGAVNSMILEKRVFDSLIAKKWDVSHSPYFIDPELKKSRELDICATKYWSNKKEDFNCRIYLLIECKSLKGYHIIVDNKRSANYYELKDFWIGNDMLYHYKKLRKIMRTNKINEKNINSIIEQLDIYCCPSEIFRNADFIFNACKIPSFNVFRETNISNTKDIDNSVIWKCQQSLTSCIESFDKGLWKEIKYSINEIQNNLIFKKGDLEKEIVESLVCMAKYKKVVHPIIVVESNLWELNKNELEKIKYFRLCFQRINDTELWLDVVHIDFIDEYFEKLECYDKFLESKECKKITTANIGFVKLSFRFN